MNPEMIVLRLLHIGGGTFWVGAALYNSFFLLPSMADAGPAGAPVMAGLQKRKLMTILPVVAIVSMLAGLRMLQLISEGFTAQYFATSVGAAYLTGAIVSIIGFLVGMFVARPAMLRAGALMASRAAASHDEKLSVDVKIARNRQRATTFGMISSLLLLAAALLMAVARYL